MINAFSTYGSSGRLLIVALIGIGIAWIVGIAGHEFSHALAAYAQGDNTAERQGRLTLNPIAHMDPIGTTLFLISGFFGWGKPTPFNPFKLRWGPRVGAAVVAAAGPISNFIMAAVFALPLLLNWVRPFAVVFRGGEKVYTIDPRFIGFWTTGNYVATVLFFVVIFNVSLGLFNLLPIFPLDGEKVAIGLLPAELGDRLRKLEPYGIGILMLILIIPVVSPQLDLLNRTIRPLLGHITRALVGFDVGF
ncbi:MAG TPA: site-2 protease family protein [Dehalococcoidia bacterium]|nr:site-2 protease family protein [Dehalococcoidia bacterium]